jgi:hypothetical protein
MKGFLLLKPGKLRVKLTGAVEIANIVDNLSKFNMQK